MYSRNLHEACFSAKIQVVQRLVSEGANVNAASAYGQTSLVMACLSGEEKIEKVLEVVNYLIQSGAVVNQRNYHGSALDACLSNAQLECVKILAANGLRVDFTVLKLEQLLRWMDVKLEPTYNFLLGVPWRSRAQKIAILEMMGATFLQRAYRYWSLALKERLLVEPCDMVQSKTEEAHTPYGSAREFKTQEELDNIATSKDSMMIQAFIIRDRLVGPYNRY